MGKHRFENVNTNNLNEQEKKEYVEWLIKEATPEKKPIYVGDKNESPEANAKNKKNYENMSEEKQKELARKIMDKYYIKPTNLKYPTQTIFKKSKNLKTHEEKDPEIVKIFKGGFNIKKGTTSLIDLKDVSTKDLGPSR